MQKSRVTIRSTQSRPVAAVVKEVMEQSGWEDIVPKGAHVVVKPNLCTPSPEIIDVANTSPEVLSALCGVLRARTDRITIGESDGVRYTAEQAFEMNGTYAIAKRHGAEVLSFSNDTLVPVAHPHLNGWPMPKTLLECDVFITTAKIKTHATTAYTGALKNQWGCIPQHNRLVLHKYLHTLIGEVNKLLKTRLAIIDGQVAMEGRGPINGRSVNLNVIAGGRDPVAVDAACMKFVGLDPATARHLVHAAEIGLGTMSPDEIELDADCRAPRPFVPAEMDWPIRMMNLITKSELLTRSLLLNDAVFFPARALANACRRARAMVSGDRQDRRLAARKTGGRSQ